MQLPRLLQGFVGSTPSDCCSSGYNGSQLVSGHNSRCLFWLLRLFTAQDLDNWGTALFLMIWPTLWGQQWGPFKPCCHWLKGLMLSLMRVVQGARLPRGNPQLATPSCPRNFRRKLSASLQFPPESCALLLWGWVLLPASEQAGWWRQGIGLSCWHHPNCGIPSPWMELRTASSLETFRWGCKMFLFSKALGDWNNGLVESNFNLPTLMSSAGSVLNIFLFYYSCMFLILSALTGTKAGLKFIISHVVGLMREMNT